MSTADGFRDVLRHVPLFDFMPPEMVELVARSFVPVVFPFGAVIAQEGDAADAFYVLASGSARVITRSDQGVEVPLDVLRPGATFGERALLEQTTRTATVRASSEVEVLRLDRSVFDALVATNPALREHLELDARRGRLRSFLRLNSPFAQLPTEALGSLLRALEPVPVNEGDIVVREGDAPGPMYVVEDGELFAYRVRDGIREDLGHLRPGDVFGEQSLFAGTPRQATVQAISPSTLFALGVDAFRELLDHDESFRARIAAQVARYDYRDRARVPPDFAEELLPADTGVGNLTTVDLADVVDLAAEDAPRAESGDAEPSPFKRPAKRLRRFPHVWQLDEMDCGAACVAMVCRHFGRKVSATRIRQAVHTSSEGTSLLGIARGGQELGLAAKMVKASKSRLDSLPLPAAVHWEGNHWVVLYDTDARRVRIADPARGLRRLHREEFCEKWSGYAALFARTPALDDAPEATSGIRWVATFIRPWRARLVLAVVLALVAAGLQMLIPVFSGVVVDNVIANRDLRLLTVLAVAMLAVLVVAASATVLQRYLLSFAAVRIDGSTLDFLTQRLLALPTSYFTTRRTGDIQRRLAGMRQARKFAVEDGVQGLTSLAQLTVAVGLMFVYSWRLALVYLAVAPLYAGLMRFSAVRLRPIYDSLEESFGKYQSRQIDAIEGIETVKAMGAEGALRRRMQRQFDDLAHRLFRADLTIMIYEGAVQMVTFLSLGLFLWVGALQVLNGRLTVGELVAFNGLVVLANAPILQVLLLWDQLQYSSILVGRLNDVLEHEPEQGTDHSQLTAVRTLDGRVVLDNLSFRYGGPGSTPIVEGISLAVAPGTTVALVGRSGSGKTTLVKCLAGLLEPTGGTIRYDGVDLRTLDYTTLRRRIGFVLQDNHLFDDTVSRNIAFGDETPDMTRVAWASRVASAHEFIERLPFGYDTRIGESGLRLSGGQRQRVAIARAIYGRPSVLILDEATSSLDSESERAVQENLDRLLRDRTSFVVAHRLSTVRDADLIVVLEKGRLVEQGTHDELMKREGLYFYLVSQQLGG